MRIRRWFTRSRKEVWSEPELPKYVKINPLSAPGADEGLQPGDMSMRAVAEEFLEEDEPPTAPALAPHGHARVLPSR